MYIYFDMNIYNRIFDSQSNVRVRFESMAIDIIFQMIEEGKYELCWSFILEYENSKNPFLYRKMYIDLMARSCKTVISSNIEIKNISEKIISNSKAKVNDAVHLACAVH
ncbi:MAG: twitching motility protein PilT, partial [Candidatus Eremiobacterota bacterium]